MKILILHRIPYYKIEYHRGIDHQIHDVFYIGTQESLTNIPDELPCEKIVRAGIHDVYDEVFSYLQKSKYHFDHLLSLSEYELLEAAKLRETFHIPGPGVLQVTKVRDKMAMKKAVAKAAIRYPIYCSLLEVMGAIIEKSGLIKGPVVLKPICGASSEDVKIFPSIMQLYKAVKKRQTTIASLDAEKPKWDQFEVEQYINAPVLHFDGLVKNKKILMATASEYIGNCLEFANGKPLASMQIEMNTSMWDWVQACINAVEIEQGCFHLEAFRQDNELIFLEIANRVGGADVVRTFELATGVHLPSSELALNLNQDLILTRKKQQKKYAWFVYPRHTLQVCNYQIIGAKRFQTDEKMLEWNQLTDNLDYIQHITYQPHETPISGLVQADDSVILRTFLMDMLQSVKLLPRLEKTG